MKIRALGQQVAEDLFAVESAIDTAIALVGRLTNSVGTARLEGNISAVVGQEVFDGVGAAVAALMEARRGVVQTHNGLSAAKDEVGLRHVAFGGGLKPIENRLRDAA